MTDRLANVHAWADTNQCVVLCVSHTDLRATAYLTPDRVRDLIAELEDSLAKLPATVTAADLGIEGAPV